MQLKPHRVTSARQRHTRGFSLVEALVSLAVLAVGVMGMASLQTRALLESRATNGRAVAVRLATDLGERMRSNPGVHGPGVANGAALYALDWGTNPSVTDCWQRTCSPAELARFDLMQWKASLNHLLPGGDARVLPAQNDPAFVSVLIGWPVRSDTPPAPWVSGSSPSSCPAGLLCHRVDLRP